MLSDPKQKEKLARAKKQVAEIKGFYAHATIYAVVNIALLLIAMDVFSGNFFIHMPSWGHFTTPFFWGIGLLFHYLKVFGRKSSIFKNWEERNDWSYGYASRLYN